MMTLVDFINYYVGLLLAQYSGLPKARGTISALVTPSLFPTTNSFSIQTISLFAVPASGTFKLQYLDERTDSINWDDDAATIQAALRALTGLGSVTVSGSLALQAIQITFAGVISPVAFLSIPISTLADANGVPVVSNIVSNDFLLTQLIPNSYDLNTAVGIQLDVLGKYVGVSRQGYDFSGPVTLTDDEFRIVIKFAILSNSNGSSLSNIWDAIYIFFPNVLTVFDYQDMRMGYFFDSIIGSQVVAEFVVKAGLLPKPMGVQLGALIYAPNINNFFGMSGMLHDGTYLPPYHSSPFNTYDDYTMDTPWLSYSDAIY